MNLSSVRFYFVILAVAVVLPAGCADRAVQISEPVTWGAARNVVQADNLFIAGQPDRQGLQMARDAGIDLVVNMRMPNEMNWDEKSVVEGLGMRYLNIPISGSGPAFDPEMIESLHELVTAHPDQKILMHCASGNRTSAWYGIYLVEKEGYKLEEALAIAEQTGLTRAALVARMREYLSAL